MNKLLQWHRMQRGYWDKPGHLASALWGVAVFGVSVWINTITNVYAAGADKNPVTDIILSNIRIFDVDPVILYLPVLAIILLAIIFIFRPGSVAFTLKTLALFVIIRCIFISSTHIGQFEPQLQLQAGGILEFLGGGTNGGLFFSGHTGIPFLFALIFWQQKWLRLTFIGLSLLIGACMLLGHLHYTIDVLGAFFITPTIYQMALWLFKGDRKNLENSFQ